MVVWIEININNNKKTERDVTTCVVVWIEIVLLSKTVTNA